MNTFPRAAVFTIRCGRNQRRLEITVNDHGLLRYNLSTTSGVPLSLQYISEQFAKSRPAFAAEGWVEEMDHLLSTHGHVTAIETALPIS